MCFEMGHSIYYPPPPPNPPPPVEELSILPPQKSKLFIPQERKFKVPTHFSLQNLLKDQRCHHSYPLRNGLYRHPFPFRFPRSLIGEGVGGWGRRG